MKNYSRIEDYTESEFLEFLRELFDGGEDLTADEFDQYMIERIKHFETITEHPDRSDVIFYPKEGQEDSPEGILKAVKEWRALNNKPGFKPE
ncbi:bacteriocin immunity protein [Pseudomonas sp. 31-12]|uniref:bacteriocin immunity protein n=1 Tax=Pseudomonas sp. 31-12 TaxID=2201356 RepID=UPI000D6D9E32|nr:bacteriocin immunity protein [Pseudomonas sp. 31-12]AWM92034.1 bacteriocin immunity protein [Pseudomonas sp. 31-12]